MFSTNPAGIANSCGDAHGRHDCQEAVLNFRQQSALGLEKGVLWVFGWYRP